MSSERLMYVQSASCVQWVDIDLNTFNNPVSNQSDKTGD